MSREASEKSLGQREPVVADFYPGEMTPVFFMGRFQRGTAVSTKCTIVFEKKEKKFAVHFSVVVVVF